MVSALNRLYGLNAVTGLAVLAVSLLLAGTVRGEETDERLAAFKLSTNCEPFSLRVGGLHPEAEAINLSRDSIVAAAESRLRAASLHDPEAHTYLFVNVNFMSEAFDIIVAFKKRLHDEYSGEHGFATTWATGATGTHGGNSDTILALVDKSVDKFLGEYQVVNEQACSSR